MIKLIVTDLDGTLLTPESKVPEGFLSFAEKLLNHGIHIAAVSGREEFFITPHFPGLEKKIMIAANNGAAIFDGGNVIERYPLPMGMIRKVCEAAVEIPKLSIALSGEKKTYFWKRTVTQKILDAFAPEIPPEKIKQIFPICNDPFQAASENQDFIGKITFAHPENAAKASFPVLAQFQSDYQICTSDRTIVNVMNKGVEKGMAVQSIQKYLNITPEETMAFGDYLNDLGMLKQAKYSYAMENGLPEVKAVAHAIAPSNREGGVLQILRREFPNL